jgi:hypothetical protein
MLIPLFTTDTGAARASLAKQFQDQAAVGRELRKPSNRPTQST